MTEEKTHRIRVKIGQAEFEAEGPLDTVNEQFTSFMQAVQAAGSTVSNQETPRDEQDRDGDKGGGRPPGAGEVTNELLDRVFHDHGDIISLTAIPDTENQKADSLLLLLYGFDKLKGESKITGVTLMKACRQSGVKMDRVDRIIDARSDLIMSGGAKRGKRYQLNNKGILHAEEIIRGMA